MACFHTIGSRIANRKDQIAITERFPKVMIFSKEYSEEVTKLNRTVFLMDLIAETVSTDKFNNSVFGNIRQLIDSKKLYLKANPESVTDIDSLARYIYDNLQSKEILTSAEKSGVSVATIKRILNTQGIRLSDSADTVAEATIGLSATRNGGAGSYSNINDLLNQKSPFTTGNYKYLVDKDSKPLTVQSFTTSLQDFISTVKSSGTVDINNVRAIHTALLDNSTSDNKIALMLASQGVNSKALDILSYNINIDSSGLYSIKDMNQIIGGEGSKKEKSMPLYNLNEETTYYYPSVARQYTKLNKDIC
ncbi:MAG: hypothetical protein EOM67_10345 [Spirochaetia bacterium]|nr:hypothetical protein [Spirochaetia bacterium]